MATILVADDDRMTRQLLESCLRTAGHAVVIAKDGREAIELLRRYPIDLVLMDMNMPELDGWTAACMINQDYRERVPVIAVTSYGLPPIKLARRRLVARAFCASLSTFAC